jgi:tetratricopeptide (TPR) repeat protein
MLSGVRFPVAALATVLACHPSATVENTMPVANLQTYRTLALRVHSSAFAAQGQAMYLEQALLQKLQGKCAFQPVAANGGADIVLDLNVTQTGRGGGGWVSNSNKATLETLLVMTDGVNGELIGTARIHGESSGMIINNSNPENEAIDVVATTVTDLLAKSGCGGPRIARAAEPPPPPPPGPGSDTPPPPGPGSAAPPDESHRAQADALNEQGKEKLQLADMNGALALFQQANTMLPDARYQYNICVTYDALEQWDNATAACKKARSMNPEARLIPKIDHKLDLIAHHQ